MSEKEIEALIKVKQYHVVETHWEEVCDLYSSSCRNHSEQRHGPFYFYNQARDRIEKVRKRLSEEGYSRDKNDNGLYHSRNYDVRVKLEERLVNLEELPLKVVRQVRKAMKLRYAMMEN